MTGPAPVAARCPGCGAAVRATDTWCGLCFQDLRPPPQPPAPLGSRLPSVDLSGGAGRAWAPDEGEPAPVRAGTYACSVCANPVPVLDDVCAVCGHDRFAALKASQVPSLPVLGDVTRFSKNTLYVAAALGSVVVAALVVLLVTIVGAIL